jgi:hypothetical protein
VTLAARVHADTGNPQLILFSAYHVARIRRGLTDGCGGVGIEDEGIAYKFGTCLYVH